MIRRNSETKLWEVSVSIRPKGMSPRSLKRINIKSEAKAKQVERELAIILDRKITESKKELWKDIVEEFLELNKGTSWNLNTHNNYETALRAYTIPKWGLLAIKDISTFDIKELILNDFRDLSESTRKSMWKYITEFSISLSKNVLSPETQCPK